MNICKKCIHCKIAGSGKTWYDFSCGAITYKRAIDPVSGQRMYRTSSDVLTNQKHPICRDINKDGTCGYYIGA